MGIAATHLTELWRNGWPDGMVVELRDLTKRPPSHRYIEHDQFADEPDLRGPQFVAYSVAATLERRPVGNGTAARVPAVWVDIDVVPKDDKPNTTVAEARAMAEPVVAMLRDLAMPPSAVYHSGAGVHAYWRLDDPADDMALVRQVNQHLATALGGDASAVNPGRVLRLPGTRNDRLKGDPAICAPWPGYPQWEGPDYYIEDLLELQPADAGAADRALAALEQLDGMPGQQRDWDAVEADIRNGVNWNSNVRDRVASMFQRGVSDVDIVAHAVEHWTLQGYSPDDTRREVQDLLDRAKQKWPAPVPAGAGDAPGQELTYEQWRSLWPFDQRANKFVDLAGDAALLTHQAWELRNAPFAETVITDDGKTKRIKWVDRYKLDLEKTVVDGADVLPYQPRICGQGAVRKLNLWRDNPAVEWAKIGNPNSDAVALFRELVEGVLCDGRESYATEIYRWAACSLFRMDERMRYALLIISHAKGTGKSLACEILRRMHHEPHTASLESLSQLTGRFTGWLQAKTLVVVQETTDGAQGRWGSMEALKSAISEEYLQVEAKFADPYMTKHYSRFIFLGNSLESLPFDANERRIFAVVCNSAPRDPDWYVRVAMNCLSEQGLADISAYLQQYADQPLALRAPESDTALIQDSLIPPFVDIINEAAGDCGDIALRGKDMNDIVRHITGQSLRGGGQAEQLRRGGWRQVRTAINGVHARFWVRGEVPNKIDDTLRGRIVDGDSAWLV